jgi:hypothetical protein
MMQCTPSSPAHSPAAQRRWLRRHTTGMRRLHIIVLVSVPSIANAQAHGAVVLACSTRLQTPQRVTTLCAITAQAGWTMHVARIMLCPCDLFVSPHSGSQRTTDTARSQQPLHPAFQPAPGAAACCAPGRAATCGAACAPHCSSSVAAARLHKSSARCAACTAPPCTAAHAFTPAARARQARCTVRLTPRLPRQAAVRVTSLSCNPDTALRAA